MGSIERSIAILFILLKHYRPMTYQEIKMELFHEYGEEVDWRTVKSHVDALIKMLDIVRRDIAGRVCVKPGLGGKNIQSIIKFSLVKNTEQFRTAA